MGHASTGPSITVEAVVHRHPFIQRPVVQETAYLLGNHRRIGTNQFARPGHYAFHSLSIVSQHEHRLAERRALLLDATRVGQEQVRASHQVDERQVAERGDQTHALGMRQDAMSRSANVGIRMHVAFVLEHRLGGF
jgi:hypothetical protein